VMGVGRRVRRVRRSVMSIMLRGRMDSAQVARLLRMEWRGWKGKGLFESEVEKRNRMRLGEIPGLKWYI
jgi:hypothetical protein